MADLVMMGIVGFKDLKIVCIIGINPEERLHTQEIFIDLHIESDFAKIAKTDDLTHATDYVRLGQFCMDFATAGKYQMLESLVHDLAIALKDTFQLNWLKVSIKKPQALQNAAFSFVESEYGKRRDL